MPRALRPASVALLGLLLAVLPAAAGQRVFSLDDPSGDDHGDGTIRYPLNYFDLRPGDLDLVRVEAENLDDGTELVFTFSGAIKKTQRRTIDIGGGSLDDVARLGFYQQNIDVYIDTDRQPGSGGLETLPGRKATIDPAFAWERAVVVTPRPFDAKNALERILVSRLREELARGEATPEEAQQVRGAIPQDVERHVHFPNRVRVRGSKLSVIVPREFLGGPAQPSWGYVIFVSGAQIDQRFDLSASASFLRQQSLLILPVAPGGAQERFGGARDDDEQQPPILDLVVGAGKSQKQILSDYDPYRKRAVALPGVVPAEPEPAAAPAP